MVVDIFGEPDKSFRIDCEIPCFPVIGYLPHLNFPGSRVEVPYSSGNVAVLSEPNPCFRDIEYGLGFCSRDQIIVYYFLFMVGIYPCDLIRSV